MSNFHRKLYLFALNLTTPYVKRKNYKKKEKLTTYCKKKENTLFLRSLRLSPTRLRLNCGLC